MAVVVTQLLFPQFLNQALFEFHILLRNNPRIHPLIIQLTLKVYLLFDGCVVFGFEPSDLVLECLVGSAEGEGLPSEPVALGLQVY